MDRSGEGGEGTGEEPGIYLSECFMLRLMESTASTRYKAIRFNFGPTVYRPLYSEVLNKALSQQSALTLEATLVSI